MGPRFSSFTLLITLGATLGHVYLYRRGVRPLVAGRAARGAVLAAIALFTALLLLRRSLRDLPPAWRDGVAQVTYAWMGVGVCLLVALLAADALRALLALAHRAARPRRASETRPAAQPGAAVQAARPGAAVQAVPAEAARGAAAAPVDAGRRALLTRGAAAAGALVGGGGLAAYGSFRAFTAPEVTEVAVRVARLPKALDGFTLVQLTDLHVGPYVRRRFMDALVERANALRPDLVAVTGDLVDGDVPTLGPSVAALQGLRSRHGTFFVTGNHDHSSGDLAWAAFLEGLGVGVLRNRHVPIGGGGRGAGFDLVGVDDWRGSREEGRRYDLTRALAGRDPERAAVLLAHQPANFREAARRGVDLQVSGHTHGGQLFPGTALIHLAWEHAAGLYREGDAHLYVSRGCGFWGPPMRVGAPPELVKLVLVAG
jgi:predicted MPP superfamily phosphohydrolase